MHVRARVRAHMRPLHTWERCARAWTRAVVGSQAFQSASAFNVNIGAWNVASVTTLALVTPPSAGARATLREAVGWVFGAAVRARVRTRLRTCLWLRAYRYTHEGCMRVYETY